MILRFFIYSFLIFIFWWYWFTILFNISDLNKVNLDSLKCDIFVVDTWYFSEKWINYKFLLYNYKNESNEVKYFLWEVYKVVKWINLVNINYSVVKKNWLVYTGILIPNYKYLCKTNFAINPWDKVRLLTTAEEIWNLSCKNDSISSYMIYDWGIDWLFFTDNQSDIKPWSFVFTNPVLAIIWHWNKLKDSYFLLKWWLLFDKDNNLKTSSDNQLQVVCYKLNIWWCWDWIVEDEFGEECDPAEKKNWYLCNQQCKFTNEKTYNDKDWDGVIDSDDLDPDVPEDIDAFLDKDGIPDIDCKDWNCIPDWFVKTNCDMCPCPSADFVWDLWKWDIIRAVLFDRFGKNPQVVSNFYKIK